MKIILSLLCVLLTAAAVQAATNVLPATPVSLEDFKLVGDLGGEQASFTLTATAHVDGAKGGSLDVLSGDVALTDAPAPKDWRVQVQGNRYIAVFYRSGKFPIKLKFNAAVRRSEPWKGVEFHVAPSLLQPIILQGLGADTKFEFAGAARPERKGSDFTSFLPSDGTVKLAWK